MKFPKLFLHIHLSSAVQIVSDTRYIGGAIGSGLTNKGEIFSDRYCANVLTGISTSFGIQGQYTIKKFAPTIQESV